jgi:hypothetical protein
MKITMREDLASEWVKVPAVNLEGVYLDAYEVQEAEFLYQCDVTGQVALKDREGRLVVLYGIDLDFTEDQPQADEPGLYEVTIFKTVDGWARYYKSAEEARQDGAKTKKRYMEAETNSNVEYFFDITQENEEIE